VDEPHGGVREERLATRLIRIPEEALPAVPHGVDCVQLVRDEVDVDVERGEGRPAMELAEDDVGRRDGERETRGECPAPARRGHADGRRTLPSAWMIPTRRRPADTQRAHQACTTPSGWPSSGTMCSPSCSSAAVAASPPITGI